MHYILDERHIYDKWMVRGRAAKAVRDLAADHIKANPLKINPDTHAHKLGEIYLNNKRVSVFEKSAADIFVIDPINLKILLITRKEPPGPNKLALPGGMFDPTDDAKAIERITDVVIKEAGEEVGAAIRDQLLGHEATAILNRRLINSDVRQSGRVDGEIALNDLFIMSSAPSVYQKDGISKVIPEAGDDARTAQFYDIRELREHQFGIPEHARMIREAMEILGLSQHLRRDFGVPPSVQTSIRRRINFKSIRELPKLSPIRGTPLLAKAKPVKKTHG